MPSFIERPGKNVVSNNFSNLVSIPISAMNIRHFYNNHRYYYRSMIHVFYFAYFIILLNLKINMILIKVQIFNFLKYISSCINITMKFNKTRIKQLYLDNTFSKIIILLEILIFLLLNIHFNSTLHKVET